MALATYSDLKAEIQSWSRREDVSDKLDTFILLAEQEMYNNRVEALIVRQQEERATATLLDTEKYVALPPGFQEMRRLMVNDQRPNSESYEVYFRTPEQLRETVFEGCPSYFTVTSQLEFNRPADQDYTLEMQYMAKPTPLSSANPTNSILTDYPLIYLAGSLWALHRWAKDAESASGAYDDFISGIIGANKATNAGRFGPTPVVRTAGRIV